jgi:hypothetical protein
VRFVPRTLTVLVALVACLALASCGAVETGFKSAREGAKNARCKSAGSAVTVKDVMPQAPAGHETVEADEEPLKPFLDSLRKGVGAGLRNIETRAVIPKGEEWGTAVVLLNFKESSGGPAAILGTAKQDAKDAGGTYEQVSVAGKDAAFVHAYDSNQITAALGDCSMVFLIDEDRKRIKLVAAEFKQPD